MAIPARFGHRVSTYTTQPLKRPAARSLTAQTTQWRQSRYFSRSIRRLQVENKSQIAPSAEAYLDSGAIQGGKNLVDVKKVLVIGSGGLSIGQAGEFDYSGMFSHLRDPNGSARLPRAFNA